MPKFDFGWGSAPDPAGGAYSAPHPLVGGEDAFPRLKMCQNAFAVELRPGPRWGSLQRSPDPLAGFKGAYF